MTTLALEDMPIQLRQAVENVGRDGTLFFTRNQKPGVFGLIIGASLAEAGMLRKRRIGIRG